MGKDRNALMQTGRNTNILEPRRLRFMDKKLINQRIRRKWREALRNLQKNPHRVKYLEDWWTDYD